MNALRRLTVLLVLALLLGGAWGLGFLWFSLTIPGAVDDTTTHTDAIVVLTGGSERVKTGLELLEDGHADRLFISGVGDQTRIKDLVSEDLRAKYGDRIAIGASANDTIGNADETARWAGANQVRSIRLVTAAYHMRRSLSEFRAAMPDVTLVSHPVFPASVRADWWRAPGTANLIAVEYTKYLLSSLRHVIVS